MAPCNSRREPAAIAIRWCCSGSVPFCTVYRYQKMTAGDIQQPSTLCSNLVFAFMKQRY